MTERVLDFARGDEEGKHFSARMPTALWERARLYEFELTHYTIPKTRWDYKLGLQTGERCSVEARHSKAFSLMIILRMLLPPSSFSSLCGEIDTLIATLTPELHKVSIDDVKHEMAFPSDWHNMVP